MTQTIVGQPFHGVVVERAAELADAAGVSVDQALRRWEMAGGQDGGLDAGAWLSVAFLYARQNRSPFDW